MCVVLKPYVCIPKKYFCCIETILFTYFKTTSPPPSRQHKCVRRGTCESASVTAELVKYISNREGVIRNDGREKESKRVRERDASVYIHVMFFIFITTNQQAPDLRPLGGAFPSPSKTLNSASARTIVDR